jgi:hypothetical protein
MLVDMNAVIPCMVVSSPSFSVRLPIIRLHLTVERSVKFSMLSVAGEAER